MPDDLPTVPDVVKTLKRADHLTGLARASMWGAARATAPKDRWQNADDYLSDAAAAVAAARAQLAAVDKQEAYCTACGVPLLSCMAGWKHWDGLDVYDAGHPADLDWRPVDRAEGS
jgi:hypothetical protein